MEQIKWTIYMHKNLINGKVYIGQTKCKNLNDRWRNGTHYENTYFGRAIQKYGWNNFEHIILESGILSLDEANEKEKYYISLYDSMNVSKGYNMTSGGSSYECSKELREKKRLIQKELWDNEEKRKQQSIRSKQYWEEHQDLANERGQSVKCIETGDIFPTYKKAGEWCGLTNYKNSFMSYFRGEKYSCGKHPETNKALHWIKLDNNGNIIEEKNIKQNLDAKKTGKFSRKVKCLETGEEFNSLQDAIKWCGLANSSSITNMIKGIKKSAGKHPETKIPLHWEYINN